MRALFREYGYSTEYKVLNATDYGVLQNRKRVILIGKYGVEEKGFYPDIPKVDTTGITVSEVLDNLPAIHAGEGEYKAVKPLKYSGKYLYDMRIKDIDKVVFLSYEIVKCLFKKSHFLSGGLPLHLVKGKISDFVGYQLKKFVKILVRGFQSLDKRLSCQ